MVKNSKSNAPSHKFFGNESFQGIGAWTKKSEAKAIQAKRHNLGYKTHVVKHKSDYVLYIKSTDKVKYPLPANVW